MLTRHNLLMIDDKGRSLAADEALRVTPQASREAVYSLIMDKRIPPIVKRQETFEDGMIDIGFSSYTMNGGSRLRAASRVPLKCIEGYITPYDVLNRIDICTDSELLIKLRALSFAGKQHGIQAGLFGSAALQLITGYEYMNESSDIDAVISTAQSRGVEALAAFSAALGEAPELNGVMLDIEVYIEDGYFAKLSELLSAQKTVLAKGLRNTLILDRKEALKKI